MSCIFALLEKLDSFFWGYIALSLIVVLGLFFSIKTKFFHVKEIIKIIKNSFALINNKDKRKGINPVKAMIASMGGMIGIGNIAGAVTAIQVGGPGALFWVWITGILGSIVKYCEVYLGFKYRQASKDGKGYDGGPMYILKNALHWKFMAGVVAVLLCIYGTEIYQFSVIVDSISNSWSIYKPIVALFLLAVVLYTSFGGVKRLGSISTTVLPVLICIYIGVGFYVLIKEHARFNEIICDIFRGAFSGHAAIGGFVGSSMMITIKQGISRAAYSSDIGIGIDAVIHSESSAESAKVQARLSIIGVIIDNMICSVSMLLVLFSGFWKVYGGSIEGSDLIIKTLEYYVPYSFIFIPIMFFITGYTTIAAYIIGGIKSAEYLFGKKGRILFFIFSTISFLFFSISNAPQSKTLLIMSVSGATLFIINMTALFKLRNKIDFTE